MRVSTFLGLLALAAAGACLVFGGVDGRVAGVLLGLFGVVTLMPVPLASHDGDDW